MSNGAIAAACCCTQDCEKDCIFNTEIESGCCHRRDPLLLWCERPGFNYKYAGHCDVFDMETGELVRHQTCCNVTQPTEEPIQAIYEYHSCWWRCITLGLDGIKSLDGLAEMCPPDSCRFDEEGDPTPCNGFIECGEDCGFQIQTCCNDPAYNNQQWSQNCTDCCAECNDEGMSEWRKRRQGSEDRWKWVNEAVCHKQGQDLGTGACCETISYSGGTFSNCTRLGGLNRAHQMLCVVHFERWWRIADCPEGVRIHVPGCTNGPGGVNCGGNIYQTDDLVPKWWIFACSGIPLYAGDLIDAVRFDVITSGEAEQFLEDLFGTCTHPDQVVLGKLAKAGYIRANDWRDEQRKAYQELNARFPGAGYASCIEPVVDMHTLGPFRKRMTCATVGVSNQPLLRKADVVPLDPNLTPLQADCFINYPGATTGATAQDDYDYWAERQWVYFRGRPGGWTWAGWNINAPCPGDEELSLLLGGGRGDGTCIEALKGGGRSPGSQNACGCCDPDEEGLPYDTLVCHGCDEPPCAIAYPSCDPPEACEMFTAKAFCEGMWFKYTNYKGSSEYRLPNGTVCNPGPACGYCFKVECLYQTNSWLLEAKRSVDSWNDSIPFTCRTEKPPLPVYEDLLLWDRSHMAALNGICDLHLTPAGDQFSWCWGCGCPESGPVPCPPSVYGAEACCGAYCPDYECDCDPRAVDPFYEINNPCESTERCPPHGRSPSGIPEQIDCIGFLPECESEEEP